MQSEIYCAGNKCEKCTECVYTNRVEFTLENSHSWQRDLFGLTVRREENYHGIRRAAVRETGVSRHHWWLNLGHPWNPMYITTSSYRGVSMASLPIAERRQSLGQKKTISPVSLDDRIRPAIFENKSVLCSNICMLN